MARRLRRRAGRLPVRPGATDTIATEELAYLCSNSGIETGLDPAATPEAARTANQLVERRLMRAGGALVPLSAGNATLSTAGPTKTFAVATIGR